MIPHCGHTLPRGLWFEQTWMYSIWECFHTSSTFPTILFFEMTIFEMYQQIQEFLIISYYRWLWPSFKLTWIPFIQWCFLSSLVAIGPVVLENVKIWKVYDNAYTNIDAADNKAKQRTKSWSENLTWAFGACEPKKFTSI